MKHSLLGYSKITVKHSLYVSNSNGKQVGSRHEGHINKVIKISQSKIGFFEHQLKVENKCLIQSPN